MFVAKAENVRNIIVVWDRTNGWVIHLRGPLFMPWTALLVPVRSIVLFGVPARASRCIDTRSEAIGSIHGRITHYLSRLTAARRNRKPAGY